MALSHERSALADLLNLSMQPSQSHFLKIVFWMVWCLAFGLAVLLTLFNLPGLSPREDITLGITFSTRYASDLGLDWKETYVALLDDIGVRHVRLPVYWDLAEPREGEYHFEDLDWQIEETALRGGKIILSVGQRVPRWPECHIPGWVSDDADQREAALQRFLREVIRRYRDTEAITVWQVENEPFLVFFGQCPPFRREMLDREIALVKSLDPSRPILTTDSGELSLWYQAAHRGDRFGTTLYRHIHKPGYGYFTYPIGPSFFIAKEWLVRLLTDQEHFAVIELQAEPWANGWVADASLPEQFRTMDEHKLRENVIYAQKVGFPEIYLWGAEWWYWLKEKKAYPAVWETAKELFREHAHE